jgi:hypothetical protein
MVRNYIGVLILMICFVGHTVYAQQIKGVVQSRLEKNALQNVQLVNIYSGKTSFTDSAGYFVIEANKGELIEVRVAGYLTARFRLSQGHVPPFFKIYLDKLVILNTDRFASSGLTQYQIDSVKSHELYRTALDYPRMSAFQQIESPFTALSRSNQQKWKFQESYAMFEREKYIDFTFNENLIRQITGLEGDDLARYMKYYRPSYEQLRNMNQYDFFSYIRQSGEYYRRISKPTAPRNSG